MIRHESDKRPYPVYGEGERRVLKQVLIGPRDGFSGFLRRFTVPPGGSTAYHHHDWYHAVYILEGSGVVRIEGSEHPLKEGSAVFVEGGREHSFSATGSGQLVFLCLVPESGDSYSEND